MQGERSRDLIRIAVVLMALLFAAPAEAARVYVIMGQGGSLTSGGMRGLAARIAQIPGMRVSVHKWKYPNVIVNDIRRLPRNERVVLVGYSLGANATTWISNGVRRPIELAVAYDPSIFSYILPAPPNVKRFLLYHNNGRSGFGHARIVGPQVETVEISEGHLAVDYDQRLHARTIAAVRAVR